MEIHHNIRQARLRAGLSQEQAARRLHTVRQTISSYETGRTQPDLDTLTALAEIYGVTLEQLLYADGDLRRRRGINKWAWVLLWVYLAALLGISALLLGLNCWWDGLFPYGYTGDNAAYMELRFSLLRVHDLAEAGAAALFRLALLVLLVVDLTAREKGEVRGRLTYFLVLAAGTLLTVLPLGAFDPVYGPVGNYWITPLLTLTTAAQLLAVDLVGLWLAKRKKRQR